MDTFGRYVAFKDQKCNAFFFFLKRSMKHVIVSSED